MCVCVFMAYFADKMFLNKTYNINVQKLRFLLRRRSVAA